MTPTLGARSALTKRTLRIAFAAVIVVVLAGQVLRYFTIRDVDRDVDQIFGDSLASIRLLERIGVERERWRILIDRHILEHDRPATEAVEKQISAAQKELADYNR